MEAQTLNEWLAKQPFVPFRIKLSNQESIDIKNPGLVVVMNREVFVAEPSRDRFHIYALMHVVGVESTQAA